jgi:hypothetical protein
MRKPASLFAAALAAASLATACGGDANDGPEIQPTYADLSQKVFVPMCSTSTCHGGGSSLTSLDLRRENALEQLVGVNVESESWPERYRDWKRVVAGQPDQSALVLVLEHHEDLDASPATKGLKMPTGGKLHANYTSAIRTWIANGARDD